MTRARQARIVGLALIDFERLDAGPIPSKRRSSASTPAEFIYFNFNSNIPEPLDATQVASLSNGLQDAALQTARTVAVGLDRIHRSFAGW